MNVLFLGYAVGYDVADSLSGISIAGNKMQVNTLKGLATFEDVQLQCITVYPVAPFPRDRKAYVSKDVIEITPGVYSDRISFLNLPIIKQIWQTTNVYRAAKKYVNKDTIIFTFNLFPQVGLPAMWLKNKYGCRTCSLLADMPIDDNVGSKNLIRNLFRRVFDRLTLKAIRACDSLIVLNRQAAIDYAANKRFIIMEGGVETEDLVPPNMMPRNNKCIIYSGALTQYSGILNLIQAMQNVTDKRAVLNIYGSGYLTEEIKRMASELPNVNYCGQVSNKEMLAIQREAFLLVNPRPVDGAIARVTFPSKIFEYMLSGTPVLTTRLNGLTEDYLSCLFSVETDSPGDIATKINEIMASSPKELLEKAYHAYEFVVREKNWACQSKRIHDFLKGGV